MTKSAFKRFKQCFNEIKFVLCNSFDIFWLVNEKKYVYTKLIKCNLNFSVVHKRLAVIVSSVSKHRLGEFLTDKKPKVMVLGYIFGPELCKTNWTIVILFKL